MVHFPLNWWFGFVVWGFEPQFLMGKVPLKGGEGCLPFTAGRASYPPRGHARCASHGGDRPALRCAGAWIEPSPPIE